MHTYTYICTLYNVIGLHPAVDLLAHLYIHIFICFHAYITYRLYDYTNILIYDNTLIC